MILERSPDTPTAVRTLEVNHKLTEDDLRTEAIAALAGKYLKTRVDAGKPVTPNMVERARIDTALPPSLAAVIAMPRKTVDERLLEKGAKVRILLSNLMLPGVLIDKRCDEQLCTLIASLADLPPQTMKPLDFSKADVLLAAPEPGAPWEP